MHRITDDPLKAKNTTNHLHVIDELRTQAGALTWTHYDTPIHNTFLKVTQKNITKQTKNAVPNVCTQHDTGFQNRSVLITNKMYITSTYTQIHQIVKK